MSVGFCIITFDCACSKINELEEELKVVGNNMKALEIAEQEVYSHAADSIYECDSITALYKLHTHIIVNYY